MTFENSDNMGVSEPWMLAGADGLYLFQALESSGFSDPEVLDIAGIALGLKGEDQTIFMRSMLRANGTDPDLFDQL